MLVMASGWRLINAEEAPRATNLSEAWDRDLAQRAFYPLTSPLTVGPGSISVAILLCVGVAIFWSGLEELINGLKI